MPRRATNCQFIQLKFQQLSCGLEFAARGFSPLSLGRGLKQTAHYVLKNNDFNALDALPAAKFRSVGIDLVAFTVKLRLELQNHVASDSTLNILQHLGFLFIDIVADIGVAVND